MKIKTKKLSYREVMNIKKPEHKLPKRPSLLFRSIIRAASGFDLKDADFSYTTNRMELAGNGPWLILMNHSSFIDLEIASKVLFPKPYCIVCTSDGFVGKEWLMRNIGCIPTQKFVSDVSLIGDINYALHRKNTSVLMYPEASYSFDGCATPLPRRLGILLKKLRVPVISIHTEGAFARDPLYNCLQKRKVKVSATVSCLFTADEVLEKSVEELDAGLNAAFTFDNFAWQRENNIAIDEPFRADGLNRILYKCAHCGNEGAMNGSGTKLVCGVCGKSYELTTLGELCADDGETEFSHIPDWYRWERECVRKELEGGTYRLDIPVDIGIVVDFKAVYMVGTGRLVHTADGFHLTGCDGDLDYIQGPRASYSIYSDYYWYELGDVICIGNKERLYYCFPKGGDVVAKTRMAAEELFKLNSRKRKPHSAD